MNFLFHSKSTMLHAITMPCPWLKRNDSEFLFLNMIYIRACEANIAEKLTCWKNLWILITHMCFKILIHLDCIVMKNEKADQHMWLVPLMNEVIKIGGCTFKNQLKEMFLSSMQFILFSDPWSPSIFAKVSFKLHNLRTSGWLSFDVCALRTVRGRMLR